MVEKHEIIVWIYEDIDRLKKTLAYFNGITFSEEIYTEIIANIFDDIYDIRELRKLKQYDFADVLRKKLNNQNIEVNQGHNEISAIIHYPHTKIIIKPL